MWSFLHLIELVNIFFSSLHSYTIAKMFSEDQYLKRFIFAHDFNLARRVELQVFVFSWYLLEMRTPWRGLFPAKSQRTCSWCYLAALGCTVQFRKSDVEFSSSSLFVLNELLLLFLLLQLSSGMRITLKVCSGSVFLQILIWKLPSTSVSWASEPSHLLCPTTEALSVHRWASAPPLPAPPPHLTAWSHGVQQTCMLFL